jgi:hypothetical protein
MEQDKDLRDALLAYLKNPDTHPGCSSTNFGALCEAATHIVPIMLQKDPSWLPESALFHVLSELMYIAGDNGIDIQTQPVVESHGERA